MDVADRRDKRARRDHADPGNRHQPQHLGLGAAPRGRSPGRVRRPPRRGSRRGAGIRRPSPLVGGQLQRRQPPATADAEHVADRRAALQPPDQHGVDLVLRARARAHELVAARQPPAHRARPLIGHPHRVQLTGGQQLGQRAGIQPIGLRARPADPGVMRADHHHARHVRLEDPRDLARVARHLQGDNIARSKTGREQLKRRRRRLDPASRTDRPGLRDRDLAEVAMHIHPDRPDTATSPSRSTVRELRWANDTDGFVLTAQPGQSQGRPLKIPGSQPISRRTACPTCVLPERPCPGHPTLRRSPDSNAQGRSLMP